MVKLEFDNKRAALLKSYRHNEESVNAAKAKLDRHKAGFKTAPFKVTNIKDKFPSGKYVGRTWKSILLSEPNYVRWMEEQGYIIYDSKEEEGRLYIKANRT